MVSDFISQNGFLRMTQEQHTEYMRKRVADPTLSELPQAARVFFEYGKNKEGYWGNAEFRKQMKIAARIHKVLYPDTTAVFVLDNSSGHHAFADDALVAERMNVFPGGQQPVLRDTIWNGQVQKIGQKGLFQVSG
jgi:hypothetical protein